MLIYKPSNCRYKDENDQKAQHTGYFDVEYKLINRGRTVVEITTCWHCGKIMSRTYYDKRKPLPVKDLG